jgi:hypothetical protein
LRANARCYTTQPFDMCTLRRISGELMENFRGIETCISPWA